MSKASQPKKPTRTPNKAFGRQQPVPFRDVVERLLQTPPAAQKKR
jgi:hypothetical protein